MADQEANPSGPGAPNGAAPSTTNGAEPAAKPSLREVAEAAYDQLTTDDGGEPQAEPAGQGTQPRDNLGRFAPKSAQPGEADGAQKPAPAPTEKSPSEAPPEHPAPEAAGRSSEPPAHWSAADRELFAKQTPEAQAFLLRRHGEMERDYTQKTQASAQAVGFVQTVAPIFQDPLIAGSLQAAGASPSDAIAQWAGFHRRAMDPNPEVRFALLQELAQRMQVDPAAIATSRSGPAPQLSEQDLKDPAIKFFADHIGRTASEVQALRQQLQSMQQQAVTQQQAEALKVSRWSIDTFADEKGPDGKLLRPDFDQLIDTIAELYKANPERDLKEAYETARWMNPATRESLIATERQSVEQREANKRAAQAVRSNVRGLTSPVSKPPEQGGKKSLRETLERAADEVGY
jgi:hypothetical protein